MPEDRRDIIVKEIQLWKESKLLPAEYCDFLLALYTQGDFENAEPTTFRKRIHWQQLFQALILILLPLSFLVIYFTELDIIMQTGLLSSFVVIGFIQVWWGRHIQSPLHHIPLIVSLLIALLLSVTVVHQLFDSNRTIFTIVALHCLLWGWIGKRFNLPYLLISCVIGIIVMLAFIVL